MSEVNENAVDLNDAVQETIDDATVMTVAIDDTLTISGEAADAKAVGDALALKADRSEIQTAVRVNGQSADAQGLILVTANETQMSSTDDTTVKAKIEAVDGKTAADIRVSSDPNAQTIAQALESGGSRTANEIHMSASDSTTVKSKIDTMTGNISNLSDAVSSLSGRTAADIRYNAGSEETIKQHVDAMTAGQVLTVNDVGPDENGNVELERVPYADNLYTDEAEQVDESFLRRTTGGSISLSDGSAWIQKMLGNRVQTGRTDESLQMTVNAMPRSTPAAITATLDKATFIANVSGAGTYVTEYGSDGWDHTPGSWGITVTNDPADGDKITVVWDGTNDPVMTVDAVQRTAPPEITATIERDVWVGEADESGTYTFTYSTEWKLSSVTVDMDDYGITVTNIPVAGDEIVVTYVKEIRGTITQATPERIVGTGWNLYDHSAGYAHVIPYSQQYGYAISGTYTSIGFATTPTGTPTAITPDAGGLFTVAEEGYVIVTGGNNTNTAIWTTWSDWDEGYAGSWEGYTESAVDISGIMTARFPYGLCKVIGTGGTVCDEIDFVHKLAIRRITRMEYSAENLATVRAAGRAYEYDQNYIWQEMAAENVNSITADEEYTISEHGCEYIDGSTVECYTEILYGANLKDKLKRDVVTLSEQTLTSGQKSQVRTNIGAAAPAEIDALADDIAVVVNGNKSAVAATSGQYVLLRNSTISGRADGGYTAAKAIPANTVIDSTYLTAISGGAGVLNDAVGALNENISRNDMSVVGRLNNVSILSTSIAPGRYYVTNATDTPTGSTAGFLDVTVRSDVPALIREVQWRPYAGQVRYINILPNSSTWSGWKQFAEVKSFEQSADTTVSYNMPNGSRGQILLFSSSVKSMGHVMYYVTNGGIVVYDVLKAGENLSFSKDTNTLTITAANTALELYVETYRGNPMTIATT